MIFFAFNLFELCCGLYFPSMGSLKSVTIPESTRSTIMNIFRVPLNIVVVVVLLQMDAMSDQTRFGVCASMCFAGVLGSLFISLCTKRDFKKKAE
jgi:MFS transporter, MFS domain-containing protein family, molybdate-anion transporter